MRATSKQFNVRVQIGSDADIHKVVQQIHLAAIKARRGDQVEIIVKEPKQDGDDKKSKAKKELDKLAGFLLDKGVDEAKDDRSAVEIVIAYVEEQAKQRELDQAEISGLKDQVKLLSAKPGDVLVDPGTKNEPSGNESPELPPLVKSAQDKMQAGKIPSAKEKKALAEWEAANK